MQHHYPLVSFSRDASMLQWSAQKNLPITGYCFRKSGDRVVCAAMPVYCALVLSLRLVLCWFVCRVVLFSIGVGSSLVESEADTYGLLCGGSLSASGKLECHERRFHITRSAGATFAHRLLSLPLPPA
jgi:hypothetical protein